MACERSSADKDTPRKIQAVKLTFFLLRILSKDQNTSGAKIAAFDLRQRGPGEIYGTSQHGVFKLKIADLTNYELLEKTKKASFMFDKKYNIGDYPQLNKRLDEYNIQQIARD